VGFETQRQRQRKYIYSKTREEVHEKWLKLQQRAQQGPIATSIPKLGEFLAYWLEEVVKPNLAPATYVNYELFVRRHITPLLGARRLDRLNVRDVQTWINDVARTCQCCAQDKDTARAEHKQRCCGVGKCREDRLSSRTVSGVRACLRAALAQAVTEDLIAKNMASSIELPSVRKRKGKAWSSEEARQFLESARSEHDALYAVYVLILVLSLRKGEVLGLTWDDVDHDEGELSIGRQLQRVSRQLLHRETKTATSDATLPLPDICAAALRLREVEEAHARELAGAAWQGGKLIFTTKWGTPIEPRNFNRSWDARCTKAGVQKITVHDGRRTAGRSRRAPAGGHADPAPRTDRGDHGDLRPSILEGHPLRVEAVRRQPQWMTPLLYFAAVRGPHTPCEDDSIGPLTWCGATCRLLAHRTSR
jgi:integrase